VAAVSSLASGFVLDLVGYQLMAVIGASVAVLLGATIAIDRRAQPAVASSSHTSG
jgi:hypothetical protein